MVCYRSIGGEVRTSVLVIVNFSILILAIVLEKDKPAKRKFIGSRSPDSVPDDLSSVDQHRDRSPTKKNKKDKDDKGKVNRELNLKFVLRF